MTEHDCNIVLAPSKINDTWCVYEHYHIGEGTEPPILVYIGAEKLVDVFCFTQARRNSEWARLYSKSGNILVRIIETHDDQVKANNRAIEHLRTFTPIPQCNLHGYNMNHANRKVLCSNGMEYQSQTDAARQLGVNQSSISKHLQTGKPRTVGGYTFKHKD